MGQKLGKQTLFDYITDFGFGNKTGIDLNGESNGILFSMQQVGPVELATTAFGQGISVTPIQQIAAVSATINGGYLNTPYIVSTLSEPATNMVIKKNEKKTKKKVISDDTSKLVRYALENVVAKGTGRNAYLENYRVGGKTGTAQKVNEGKYMVGNYILSFVGFTPADNPQIVVYVAIDNPKNVVQYGGTVAAPIAKNILSDAINVLDISKSKEGLSKEYTWIDTKYLKVPNVVGMNLKEAQKALNNFKVNTSGSGNKIIYQSPSADDFIEENGVVKVMLE